MTPDYPHIQALNAKIRQEMEAQFEDVMRCATALYLEALEVITTRLEKLADEQETAEAHEALMLAAWAIDKEFSGATFNPTPIRSR